MELPSFLYTTKLDSNPPSFQQLGILIAFFVVVALVARYSITAIFGSKHSRDPSGLATFARFFYASFLKPHSGDGAITGQQAALESFYKAQVAFPFSRYQSLLDKSGGNTILPQFVSTLCLISHHVKG